MLSSAQRAILSLTEGKNLRIWSFLITIFGDLAQGHGQWISSRTLGLMCKGVGAKLESQRVAIHRLRKDGWLYMKKEGRRSYYSLTEVGLKQASNANLKIYAGNENQAKQAWLLIHQAGVPFPGSSEYAQNLTPHIWISSKAPTETTSLAFPLDASIALPSWLADKICGAELVDQSQDLLRRLRAVRNELAGDYEDLKIQERAFVRTLIVHEWRRLILKAPSMPDYLFPEGWKGKECRKQVLAILDEIGTCDLDALQRAFDGASSLRPSA